MLPFIVQVALDTPLDFCFDYHWIRETEDSRLPKRGQLVLVPFGHREVVGLIVAVKESTDISSDKLRGVIAIQEQVDPLSDEWLEMCSFAASYYQRPLGEVALPCLPKNLRLSKPAAFARALKALDKEPPKHSAAPVDKPALHDAQREAAEAIVNAKGFAPILLHGVTGSGKTEVYLQATEQFLARTTDAQVMFLVPEINLTPQLENSIRTRFPEMTVATLHSGLAEGARMKNWLAAHTGRARIILGTRLAVLASVPRLSLIIIDEEHDTSYKQQEGLRYSARDLAVWRARQLTIPVVLGSATPSLESWQHGQSGRYHKLELRERAVKDAVLPAVRLIDTGNDKPKEGFTSALLNSVKLRLERGEQSLLFLNRRGYAPVLVCESCGWVSNCMRCTSFMVLHKSERRLRCHHCSLESPIPRSCPTCGNVDLQPLGRGTQRIEESLQQRFPNARILRIDADSTRRKGSAQAALDSVHRGDVDILIGTQMVAKGHDFQRLTLVGIVNPDTALFSHDYRASERLFAQLMQVGGRAGRGTRKEGGSASEVLIQTRYPHHPLYAAVIAHDYDRFAASLLEERRHAALPPFMFQALLRAEAKNLELALDFLHQAANLLQNPRIVINEPIPMAMTRVANVDRAQLLVESASRPELQAFLKIWMPELRALKTAVKWQLEVDPVAI
jgi:primosomal protein N' (replication factor Y)